jgi:predicted dehydrogenase
MNKTKLLGRRAFLGSSALAVASPYWMPAKSAWAAPSDRLVFGAIGMGGRNVRVAETAAKFGTIAAVCDVDSKRVALAQRKYSDKFGRIPDGEADYRKILERKDIDAVIIGTPDHWHAKIAIEAMQAGKHVYCEKPLTLTIEEGQKICRVAKATGVTFQVGTQQRTEMDQKFLKAVALVRDGRIGDVKHVWVAINGAPRSGELKTAPVPKGLDWNAWLGQAPLVDYIPERCHYEFRWWYEYSGGKLTDWGAHHVDIAQWALGLDDTSPVKISPEYVNLPVAFEKGYPVVANQYNTAVGFRVKCEFANGLQMHIQDNVDEPIAKFPNGILWEGDDGNLFVNRGRLNGRVVDQLADNPLAEGTIERVYNGRTPTSHMQDFAECIKSGEQPISDVYSHHRTLTTCHLANIAIRLNRAIEWDPTTETIVGDDEAQSFASRTPRAGFEIPG